MYKKPPLASDNFEARFRRAQFLQFGSNVRRSTFPIHPRHIRNDRSPLVVPLITADGPKITVATISLSRIFVHGDAISYLSYRDDLIKPHYPLKFKPQPLRKAAGSFVCGMIEAVNTTKTKTMGRWVKGEKEEKARGCAADKGALERRKHSELRRELAPMSMSLLENSKQNGWRTKAISTLLFCTSALIRPTMPANSHFSFVCAACALT